MRKIFIPENRKELRGLVRKLVGLWHYTDSFSVDEYCYYGINGNNHEFIKQDYGLRDSRICPKDNIRVELIRDNCLVFEHHGIRGISSSLRFYNPQDNEYEERLKLLKENGFWKEPK